MFIKNEPKQFLKKNKQFQLVCKKEQFENNPNEVTYLIPYNTFISKKKFKNSPKNIKIHHKIKNSQKNLKIHQKNLKFTIKFKNSQKKKILKLYNL